MSGAWVALLVSLLLQRTYYKVSLPKIFTHTHVEVCGKVTYVRKERDRDIHVTITDGKIFVVAEIIPTIPLQRPKVGQYVRVKGISRKDPEHAWYEVHPAEEITTVLNCE